MGSFGPRPKSPINCNGPRRTPSGCSSIRAHGLFFWTPILLLAVVGLGLLIQRDPRLGIALATGFLLTWYLNGAFQTWTTAGAFGARRFIVCSPIFAVGLAEVFRRFGERTSGERTAMRLWVPIVVIVAILWNGGLILQFVAPRYGSAASPVAARAHQSVHGRAAPSPRRSVADGARSGLVLSGRRVMTDHAAAVIERPRYDDAYFRVQQAKSAEKVALGIHPAPGDGRHPPPRRCLRPRCRVWGRARFALLRPAIGPRDRPRYRDARRSARRGACCRTRNSSRPISMCPSPSPPGRST